jgi:hypothetical protein
MIKNGPYGNPDLWKWLHAYDANGVEATTY